MIRFTPFVLPQQQKKQVQEERKDEGKIDLMKRKNKQQIDRGVGEDFRFSSNLV